MRIAFLPLAALITAGLSQGAGGSAMLNPDAALEWMKFGNERHAACRYVRWHQTPERRREVAGAQRPHAVVLTCADSQVPPELVFDQGVGDLYVIRVAGAVAGDRETASIEYAADQLMAPLVVVLGHERCGIVEAAVNGAPARGSLGSVLALLAPAVARAQAMGGGTMTSRTTRVHVEDAVRRLNQSEPVIAPLIKGGRLRITGGVYNDDTGVVDWMPAGRPTVQVSRH